MKKNKYTGKFVSQLGNETRLPTKYDVESKKGRGRDGLDLLNTKPCFILTPHPPRLAPRYRIILPIKCAEALSIIFLPPVNDF